MLTRLGKWINKRWPLSDLIRLGLEEEILGGSSYAYVFGSLLLFTFAIQAATGVWQLFYYVPTVQHAYDSVNYLRTEVPFGWLIHGLHYWGANAMVILLLCHAIRVFTWAAYKNPRELTWLAGVGLFLITLAMSFTGAPLPWDERGYWATEVGTSIAGTVPFIGNLTKQLMRGGETMGQLALSRMFVLHIAIIPGALFAMVGIHLVAFRRNGSVGPWDEAKRARKGQFWPDQLFKDTLSCTILFIILIALVVLAPPPFAGPADPLDTLYTPKPEWNFLFLYESLKFFPGKLEPVGTVGIPALGILVLVLLPFFDRKAEHSPGRRLRAMSLGALAILGLIVLTIVGYYSKPGAGQKKGETSPAASIAQTKNISMGRTLFQSQGCAGCHRVNGSGGNVGPNLSGEGMKGRSMKWLRTQLRSPKAHDPQSVMPAFSALAAQQIDQLADYLLSLKSESAPAVGGASSGATAGSSAAAANVAARVPGKAAFIIGSAEHGALLFEKNCVKCHGPRGTDHVSNPGSTDLMVPALNPIDRSLYNISPKLFATTIDLIIQHGSHPAGPHPVLHMPAFGDTQSLTQEEISDLEAYILNLNGVNRGEITHPGLQPRIFLGAVAGIFALVMVAALGMYFLRKSSGTGKKNS
ncbi:MAG: c-type cytochrome [Proteobacteria bacterium]|nr:c-type cytochrome [Pseudomonadota bacterium]